MEISASCKMTYIKKTLDQMSSHPDDWVYKERSTVLKRSVMGQEVCMRRYTHTCVHTQQL